MPTLLSLVHLLQLVSQKLLDTLASGSKASFSAGCAGCFIVQGEQLPTGCTSTALCVPVASVEVKETACWAAEHRQAAAWVVGRLCNRAELCAWETGMPCSGRPLNYAPCARRRPVAVTAIPQWPPTHSRAHATQPRRAWRTTRSAARSRHVASACMHPTHPARSSTACCWPALWSALL